MVVYFRHACKYSIKMKNEDTLGTGYYDRLFPDTTLVKVVICPLSTRSHFTDSVWKTPALFCYFAIHEASSEHNILSLCSM